MNRIAQTFEQLARAHRKALVGFLVAGDPDLEGSERHCRAALENGVDILELGVPFSDPTADGPVIQAAAQRALAAGITVQRVLALAARLRRDYSNVPIVLFGYANPFFDYGYGSLAKDAAEAGVDAFLVVDLPFEESGEFRVHLDKAGLDFISLIAPTTPEERMATILEAARGFVYYIRVKGITGERAGEVSDVSSHLGCLKRHTRLPVVAGFGVGTGAQIREAGRQAEGVVVGSALVKAAGEGRLGTLVRELRQALDSGNGN